jgi:uncharacterized protein (TIGR00297 family)
MAKQVFLQLLCSLIAAGALAGLAAWRKALTPGGLALAFCLALVICYCGGLVGYLVLVATFVFTIAAGKISGRRRERLEKKLHAKTGPRDAVQIVCNVAVGTLALLLFRLTGYTGLLWAYGGAMAASLADSMASELGVLSKRAPRDILSWKVVEAGLSGGVTALGFGMSVLGAALIALVIALPRSGPGFAAFVDVTAAGTFAAICDSALGSGVQVKFRCGECGALTEKPVHCGVPGTAEKGVRWMTNDAVNLCNNILGALAALALYALHH